MNSILQERTKRLTTDLEECLGPRGSHLEHDGEDGEDDDLDGGAPRVPVGPAYTVLRRKHHEDNCQAHVQVPIPLFQPTKPKLSKE